MNLNQRRCELAAADVLPDKLNTGVKLAKKVPSALSWSLCSDQLDGGKYVLALDAVPAIM
jgi:hypothetical protein